MHPVCDGNQVKPGGEAARLGPAPAPWNLTEVTGGAACYGELKRGAEGSSAGALGKKGSLQAHVHCRSFAAPTAQ